MTLEAAIAAAEDARAALIAADRARDIAAVASRKAAEKLRIMRLELAQGMKREQI